MRFRILLFIVAVALLASIGIAHGVVTGRWGESAELLAACDKLQATTIDVDGWKSAPAPIDQRQLDVAGARASMSRLYQKADGTAAVSVTVLCGRHGPISLHPPTVCFTGAGMSQVGAVQSETMGIGAAKGTFSQADFASNAVGDPNRRTWWAWSNDGQKWTTPKSPRIEFASSNYLYKIYFITPVEKDGSGSGTSQAVSTFMTSYLTNFSEAMKPPRSVAR
jgi:hypothetical protein